MRLNSPCWAVSSVDWSCLKLLFYFSFCDCVIGTALRSVWALSCYSAIPVTIAEKIKHQFSESAVPPAHCSQLLCESWLFHSTQELISKVVVGRRPQPSSSVANCAIPEPHLGLKLLAPSKTLYLGWPISSGTVPMQGPGLAVVFWTAGFVYCGFLVVLLASLLDWVILLQYSLRFPPLDYRVCTVSGYISSSLVLCLLCIFLWTHPEPDQITLSWAVNS